MRDIRVFENIDQLISAAGEMFVDIADRCIEERQRFTVALSGGSTPEPVYKLIAEQYRSRVDWGKVFFFLGDERNVPADSAESNYRMVNEALFSPLGVKGENVRAWPTGSGDPDKIAAEYSRELRSFFDDIPRFDLFLLGLGDDGHTASLFPDSPALKENEEIAVSNWVEKLQDHRLTMTFPVINNAAIVMFLVAGEGKADSVAHVLEGEFRPDDLPAQFVNPIDGDLYWLLDEAAASGLKER